MMYWLRLRRMRIKEQKKLYNSSLKLFKKITEYIYNSNLKNIEKEEALHQIMDIILQAQADRKTADMVIEDYEVFCKAIIEEYTKDKSALYTGLHHLQKAVLNMLYVIIPAVIFVKAAHPAIKTGINAYLLISAMGFAFILMPFSHNSKQRKWASAVYFIALMTAISFVTETQWGLMLNDSLIGSTNIILFVMAIIAAAIEIYKRLYDTRNINK